MSSELQFEHTGVERATLPVRSSIVRGTSATRLNGLISAARRICFSPLTQVLGTQPTPETAFRKIATGVWGACQSMHRPYVERLPVYVIVPARPYINIRSAVRTVELSCPAIALRLLGSLVGPPASRANENYRCLHPIGHSANMRSDSPVCQPGNMPKSN